MAGVVDGSPARIPVIDISSANAKAPQQLLSAASEYGFVFVENNDAGIAPQAIDRMFDLSRNFFSAPIHVKEQAAISSNSAGKNVGWLKQGVERLDPVTQRLPDVKEAVNISAPLDDDMQKSLPAPLMGYRTTIVDFQHACHLLCLRLLSHFATALSLQSEWFATRHDHDKGVSGTILRLLYYPKCSSTADDIRAGAHSDYGSLTLLFQLRGQPGLEIRMPDGRWACVPVDPLPVDIGSPKTTLPILVNIGDLFEDWTGGLLKSTVHRVVFPENGKDAEDRYSIAYFCHPLDDVLLEPVPSEMVRSHVQSGPGRRHEITARQHLMERLAATYKINGHD